MERPTLCKQLDANLFLSFYYLKAELVNFCRQEALQTTGNKAELTKRIAHYLKTGEKIRKTTSCSPSRLQEITLDSIIETPFVCSEKHRAFYREQIGPSFSFKVSFQTWLKQNAGKTYRDSLIAYKQIVLEQKTNKTQIAKQFEYNTYIRDFFAANQNRQLHDAIACWNYKKSLAGHNRYEATDLTSLGE